MARLKAAWPGCRFTWLVNSEWAPLLDGNPDIDEVISFPRQKFRGPRGWLNLARWSKGFIGGRPPDLTLDFQGLLRTALIGRASRAGVFYGMADAREGARWFYDRSAPMPAGVVHAVDRYLSLTSAVLGTAAVRGTLDFPLPAGVALMEAAGTLRRGFVLLHPFARGSGKSLTPPQIEVICQRLSPRQTVLIGKASFGHSLDLPDSTVDLLDRTSLLQLIWVIRRASCVVSVDSGPAHLAAALGKSLVAIHTWSDPRRVGPYREDATVWKNGRLMTMKQIHAQDEAFFKQVPPPLNAVDIEVICERAISLSDSYA